MSASRRDEMRLVHSLSHIERDEKQSRNDMAQSPSEIIDVLECWNGPCITHCSCDVHLPTGGLFSKSAAPRSWCRTTADNRPGMNAQPAISYMMRSAAGCEGNAANANSV